MKLRLIILYAVIFLLISTGCSTKIPEIPEEAINGSEELMEGNQEVEEAGIMLEENKLRFYLAPIEETEVSQERLRELAVDFLKFLGGYVANDELLGPIEESYGQIYDYYDVEIVIEGYGKILDRGTMTKGSNELIWE